MRLVIAEKPQLGKAIAAAIPGDDHQENSVITKTWHGEPISIVWCVGHMLTLEDPEDFDARLKEWRLEDLPITFENVRHKIGKDGDRKGAFTKESRVKQIGELLKKADSVIHAGDDDEEGQLLIDELLRWHHYTGPVMRLDTQDTSAPALQKALNNMTNNDAHIPNGLSAYGRELSDKIFGYNLSRFYSIINGTPLSVGRVQTPTLGMVVQRDLLIEAHKKILYFTLNATLKVAGQLVIAKYQPATDDTHLDEGRILDRKYLESIAASLQGKNAENTTITKSKAQEASPLPFNLTKLTSWCGNKWDMTPSEVMSVTQDLREKYQAITYNRSDCQYLSMEHFAEAPKTLPLVIQNLGITNAAIDPTRQSKCFNDANLTAHFAIIPTQTKQDISKFTPNERKVYEIIALYYLAQFMPPTQKDITKLLCPVETGGALTATSTSITDKGYRSLLGDGDEKADDDAASADEGTALSLIPEGCYTSNITEVNISDKETTPPTHYTQASLIEDMTRIAKYVENDRIKQLLLEKDKSKKGENGSIGTSATRPAIVALLLKRGYLQEFKKGKKTYIVATDLGKEFYNMLPDSARKVDITAKWYVEQENIKQGTMTPEFMAQDVLKSVRAIIERGCTAMTNANKYSQGLIGVPIGKCPKCGGEIYETAKGYKCNTQECRFWIGKDNHLFAALGKTLSPKAVTILLKTGKVGLKNCTSKTGAKYDTIICCDFAGDYPEFTFVNAETADAIGVCPKCHGEVKDMGNRYACAGEGCTMVIWKNDKFWESLGKSIQLTDVQSILKSGRVSLTKCKSKKTGKQYSCTILADMTGPRIQWEFAKK